MRKLATLRKIGAVTPIEGADAIECATVGGWKVVVKKGEFKPGDLAVYCEIDSWIPHSLAPFLSKGKEPRVFEGVAGERLRTVKLRGQISQGLLLPKPTGLMDAVEGDDLSEYLGIQKWEMPVPAQLAGQVKGSFPTQVPKTDQERCQNLVAEIQGACADGLLFELTEKLEGSSMTCYMIQGEFGVCSRNLDLKRDEQNSLWRVAIRDDIEGRMRAVDTNQEGWDWAIQGELIGPGVQGNIYRLKDLEFRVFDVYNIQTGEYLDPASRRSLIERMGLQHVPVICADKDLGVGSVDELLLWAEDRSRLNPDVEREGIVFKEVNGGFSFKAISNRYLLGEK